jgi:hypothetical protein
VHSRAPDGDIELVLQRARDDVGHKLWQLKECAEAAVNAKATLDTADAESRDAMGGAGAGQLSAAADLR